VPREGGGGWAKTGVDSLDEPGTMAGMASKWISVDKRLPKWGQQVLVAHRRYNWSNARHKCTRLKKLGVTPATFWVEDEDGPRFTEGDDVVEEPVAWMPLPEPPEVK
jgi:hypothetical protein